MDPAQQNRFVWLYMNADYMQWIDWAIGAGIEEKVIEFISSYPEYLNQRHEDDIDATPRSFERVSGLYTIYKKQEGTSYSRDVFMNVIRGNVGKLIAEAFVNFYRVRSRTSYYLLMMYWRRFKTRCYYVYG